jgi:uncharacterized membrane protein
MVPPTLAFLTINILWSRDVQSYAASRNRRVRQEVASSPKATSVSAGDSVAVRSPPRVQPSSAAALTSEYVNPIVVRSSIDLPFSPRVAYDAFSDLPRQPSWSPWLKDVCYVDGSCEVSQWTMKIAGLPFSWRSISTHQDRPRVIEWESTSGIRNKGRVDIQGLSPDGGAISSLPSSVVSSSSTEDRPDEAPSCRMTLTMVFQAPRVVAALFRNDFSALQRQMEERILGRTLSNFRDVVLRQDLRETSRHQERLLRASGMLFPH